MKELLRRSLSLLLCLSLTLSGLGLPGGAYAQLPEPGNMVLLSAPSTPLALMGLKVFPSDPFRLDFIMDKGDLRNKVLSPELKPASERLVKYFLAGLTIPQDDLWVNLSPYEGDRIIAPALGRTDLGRDLLEQDYVLKQVAATVLYPQGEEGKRYWKEVYARAHAQFGTIDIPVETFNKVWIVPDKARVFENKDRVFIVESRLKVMLESDYLAEEKQKGNADFSDVPEDASARSAEAKDLTRSVMREVIIPVLEKEVNEGANFATLRQVYHSLILAVWYKRKIQDSILAASYVDRKKVNGVTIDDPRMAEKIWSQYVEAFKKGAYNYIQEEVDPLTQEAIPRKYFSGGMGFQGLQVTDAAQISLPEKDDRFVRLRIENRPTDNAMEAAPGSLGYVQEVHSRVDEGKTVALRAVMPNMGAEAAENYRVILYSNKDGAWKDGEVLDFVGVKDGQAVFETKVEVKLGFEYTFVFERKSDGYREWADLPYGNGTVIVDRKFEGNVVFVGMEFGPLVKKGGQGDVMYELPRNLVKAGVKATVVIPYFKKLAAEYAKKGYVIEDVPGMDIKIDFQHRPSVNLKVKKAEIDGITIYMLDAEGSDLFIEPYPGQEAEFYESVLLSQGVSELLAKLGQPVDIVQFNDHHAALVPLYMAKKHGDFFAKTGRIFTIHNIGYQGEYWDVNKLLGELGLGVNDDIKGLVVKSGQINFMAVPAGMAKQAGNRGYFAGTVSPTYAEEIRHTQFELDKLLQDMGNHFGGIMNGIDTEVNDPYTDKVLKSLGLPNYRIEDGVDSVKAAKSVIKRFIRETLGEDKPMPKWETGKIEKTGYLPEVKEGEPDRLLVGSIGRNVKQKQVDIIADMVQDMVEGRQPVLAMDIVIAGPSDKETDDQESIRRLQELSGRARQVGINIVILNGFVREFANVLYAGFDGLIMPSDFEPAGISQQLAKRYGTVPVVRKTGGLADTVFEGGSDDNGFVFTGTFRRMDADDWKSRAQNTYEFYQATRRAVETYYNDQASWRNKIQNGMRDDSSWTSHQKDYLNVYAWLKDQLSDNAQASLSPYGGIDLTADRFNLETTGPSVQFSAGLWSREGLENIQINGLVPAVISVAPEWDLSGFLGLPLTQATAAY